MIARRTDRVMMTARECTYRWRRSIWAWRRFEQALRGADYVHALRLREIARKERATWTLVVLIVLSPLFIALGRLMLK